ncbi:ATP synthase subunit I [Laspinema sp. D1]|uniref:ATP synthase subunit I n=2 Tax=Laspinema TaxID=2584823 RepID=A0ABT2MRV5_9CYAN|nr:ATP synthase subunit I [Laspinema sp. D2a]
MNLSDPSEEPTSQERELEPNETREPQENSSRDSSMDEYHQLKQKLLVSTLVITIVVFVSVWFYYSLNIALNYLIGACTGVVYLRMLARDVERLGNQKQSLSKGRLAMFIGLIIVATQWDQLQVMPIFLGFLTYKAALLVYVLQTTLLPDSK